MGYGSFELCFFWEEDIEAISRIPVGSSNSIDVRRWYFTSNGYYYVRTAYHVARDLKRQRVTSSTGGSSSNNRKDWSFV